MSSAGDAAAPMRLLLLGGTTEASALAVGLAGRPRLAVTLSLAGRTAAPAAAPVPVRVGGFGGPEGLARWLRGERVDLLVDATHPFAATISRNAARGAGLVGIPLLALRRPPWVRETGDRWVEVASIAEAGSALARLDGAGPVFVTIGRQELGAFFAAAPRDRPYLVRAIEPVRGLVPPGLDARELLERGPFAVEAEEALMRQEGVAALVTKNAGGAATYAKVEAARRLQVPIVIVAPPEKPDGTARVAGAWEALGWILARHAALSTERGV